MKKLLLLIGFFGFLFSETKVDIKFYKKFFANKSIKEFKDVKIEYDGDNKFIIYPKSYGALGNSIITIDCDDIISIEHELNPNVNCKNLIKIINYNNSKKISENTLIIANEDSLFRSGNYFVSGGLSYTSFYQKDELIFSTFTFESTLNILVLNNFGIDLSGQYQNTSIENNTDNIEQYSLGLGFNHIIDFPLRNKLYWGASFRTNKFELINESFLGFDLKIGLLQRINEKLFLKIGLKKQNSINDNFNNNHFQIGLINFIK